MPPKTANPSKTGARQKASPDVSQGVQQTDQQRPEQLRSLEERKNQLSLDLLKVEGQACSSSRSLLTCLEVATEARAELADSKLFGQIFDLESRYLDSCNAQGNALTGVVSWDLPSRHKLQHAKSYCACAASGYEGLLAKPSTHSRKAPARPTDRLFSSSSVTGASK